MAEDVTTPKGLVLFAQADLLKSLQSICWLQQRGGLDAVCIYHTTATQPLAERLRRFCSKQWPQLKVIVPGEAGATTSAKVAERLRDWRSFRPEVSAWMIDATGVPASMAAGIGRVAEEDPAFSVMAAASDGSWQALRPLSGGRLDPSPLTDSPPATVADGLSLADLIPALAGGEIEVLWRESRAPERLEAAELAAIVGAGSRCNWNWRAMYEAGTGRTCRDWTFEEFVAATLAACGVANVRLRVHLKGGSPDADETFDIMALQGGRLRAVDCHYRLETQEETAAAAERPLWRLVPAERIVLRPWRWATETERALAAAAGAALWDCDDCRTLFSRLGRLLGLDVPGLLRDAERGLARPGGGRLPVFSPATPAQQFSAAMHVTDGIFDLVRGARADAGGTPPPWTAARLGPDLWFVGGRVPAVGPSGELRERLADKIAKGRVEADIIFFDLSRNRHYWRALVRVGDEGNAFSKWLARWRNVPLIL